MILVTSSSSEVLVSGYKAILDINVRLNHTTPYQPLLNVWNGLCDVFVETGCPCGIWGPAWLTPTPAYLSISMANLF